MQAKEVQRNREEEMLIFFLFTSWNYSEVGIIKMKVLCKVSMVLLSPWYHGTNGTNLTMVPISPWYNCEMVLPFSFPREVQSMGFWSHRGFI